MAPDQRAIDAAYGVQHIDEAYVKSLADPLVRYMDEPPHDPLTVLAIACRAALSEAWEQIEHGETHLRMFDGTAGTPRGMDEGIWMSHGEIMAGKRVIRRVAEVLKLMHPGELATPGERLYAARTAKRLTHDGLAREANVDRSHVSRVERGDRTLTRNVAVLVSAVLDVTPEYLLTGKDHDE